MTPGSPALDSMGGEAKGPRGRRGREGCGGSGRLESQGPGWAKEAEVNLSPALTFLPRSAPGLSKQADSAPAGAAIVSWRVPLTTLWSAEAGGDGGGPGSGSAATAA